MKNKSGPDSERLPQIDSSSLNLNILPFFPYFVCANWLSTSDDGKSERESQKLARCLRTCDRRSMQWEEVRRMTGVRILSANGGIHLHLGLWCAPLQPEPGLQPHSSAAFCSKCWSDRQMKPRGDAQTTSRRKQHIQLVTCLSPWKRSTFTG